MNKQQLVESMAKSANLTKAEMGRPLQGFMNMATDTLARGGQIFLIGFGTFTVVDRQAKACRNPQTGELMGIPAGKAVRFRPGKKPAEAVSSRGY